MIKKIDRLDEEVIIPLADNAIKTSQFIKDKNFAHNLLNRWAIYFNAKTQNKYVYIDDDTQVVLSLCFCIVGDSTKDVHYDISDIVPIHEDEKQYMTFRKRITKGYSEISITSQAELEIMSSLEQFKGYGSQLLNTLEQDLIKQQVTEYIVCTNEMCSYQWYERHGFELYKDKYIDISDLDLIFPDKKEFRLICYKKQLIK